MGTMFGNGSLINDSTVYYALNYIVYFIFALLISTPIFKLISNKLKGKNVVTILAPVGLMVLLVVSVSYIVKGGYNPFIYFNF
jgi:alginate O-acetyltransferase complex protein AlgI